MRKKWKVLLWIMNIGFLCCLIGITINYHDQQIGSCRALHTDYKSQLLELIEGIWITFPLLPWQHPSPRLQPRAPIKPTLLMHSYQLTTLQLLFTQWRFRKLVHIPLQYQIHAIILDFNSQVDGPSNNRALWLVCLFNFSNLHLYSVICCWSQFIPCPASWLFISLSSPTLITCW